MCFVLCEVLTSGFSVLDFSRSCRLVVNMWGTDDDGDGNQHGVVIINRKMGTFRDGVNALSSASISYTRRSRNEYINFFHYLRASSFALHTTLWAEYTKMLAQSGACVGVSFAFKKMGSTTSCPVLCEKLNFRDMAEIFKYFCGVVVVRRVIMMILISTG